VKIRQLIIALLVLRTAGAQEQEILQPVPFSEVTLEDSFWLPRLERQKKAPVPPSHWKKPGRRWRTSGARLIT
jgi:hypothetical protein